jgi:hypothetical protein
MILRRAKLESHQRRVVTPQHDASVGVFLFLMDLCIFLVRSGGDSPTLIGRSS